MPWSVDAAVAHLQTIKVPPWGQGKCAKHVRLAVAAGGIAVVNTPHAKDYGIRFVQANFVEFNGPPTDGYKKGDIVVMQSISGHPSGHVQMYDGEGWISDHQQPHGFWPSNAYKGAAPSYKTYRHE